MKKKLLAIILVFCMVTALFPAAASAKNACERFDDVDLSQWYVPYVNYVLEHGLMAGVSTTKFSPEGVVSRAQYVQTLYAKAGKPVIGSTSQFQDLKENAYYVDAVNWAAKSGVTSGLSVKSFGPNVPVTREQAATFFMAYAENIKGIEVSSSADLTAFPDHESVSKYAIVSMQWAVASGLIKGMQAGKKVLLAPKNVLTRAQLATMLKAFEEYLAKADDGKKEENPEESKTPGKDDHGNNDEPSGEKQNEGKPETESAEDKDHDDVPSDVEVALGSSDEQEDTDGDGIRDYDEIYEVGSDPAVANSEEDYDNDGLSNYDEITVHHTNPRKSDSDLDGISDGEEISKYKTDPLKEDSDGDDISDGDEVRLGTDPLKKNELSKIVQTLGSSNIDESLLDDNDAIPSIHGMSSEVLDSTTKIDISTDSSLNDNRAVVGKAIEVSHVASGDITLSFTLSDPDCNPVVFFLDEKEGWEPLDSSNEGNKVSARITEDGTYCVMDLDVLLPLLGIDIGKYNPSEGTVEEVAEEAPELLSSPTGNNGSAVAEVDQETVLELSGDIVNQSVELLAKEDVLASEKTGSGAMGQADIVFAVDTTGSMSGAISNVANNIISFVDVLVNEYHVNANFALVNYRDITCDGADSTHVEKNGKSNWYSNPESFKKTVAALTVDGGGDGPECSIDGLEMARQLDFRKSSSKFIILITDADYKNDNNYGIESMSEEVEKLNTNGIVTSVVSSTGYKDLYHEVYSETGGIFADIYGDFSKELLKLAGVIGEEVNAKNWILLDDYQYVALDKPLNEGADTDRDGIKDRDELKSPKKKDLSVLVRLALLANGVPNDVVNATKINETITVYPYTSNPGLPDTDFDGIRDDIDNRARDNTFAGTLKAHDATATTSYSMDYRVFFDSNMNYYKDLAIVSAMFSAFMYSDGGYRFDEPIPLTDGTEIKDSTSIKSLMRAHGFDDVIDYKLEDDYKDDDISEVALGHHTIVYNGKQKEIVGVFVRGTNGTIKEWSSNFDLGDTSESGKWSSPNHRGFDVTTRRILEKVQAYCDKLKGSELVYWVSGHSRGAAISNLLAKYLIDAGNEVFAYTFATPNTTVDSSAKLAKYRCIWNFVNEDDFVPKVPMDGWGFTRFGNSCVMDMNSSMEKEWNNIVTTGGLAKHWYNQMSEKHMDKLVSSLEGIADGWDDCYRYPPEEDCTAPMIPEISKRAVAYCKRISYKDPLGRYYPGLMEMPAFFMVSVGELVPSKLLNKVIKVLPDQYGRKYRGALGQLVLGSTVEGIAHPHYLHTYYIIAQHVSQSSFGGGGIR